jgi:hypothetical protein
MRKLNKYSENRLIKISEPLFQSKLLIYVWPFSKLLKQHFWDEYNDSDVEGLYHKWVMWIYKLDIPIFVHELQHFTRDILNYHSVVDNETWSYFMEYYTREFLNAVLPLYTMKKKKWKKKK